MALFDWTTTKQAAIYTRQANRARREGEASKLRAPQPMGEQAKG
jgi:hypothetical protein